MTRRDFPLIHGKVQALCSSAGVALVLTPEFAGTHLSGAARWLAPDKAILQLSLRHKTDDHFWFTFFHEARHLLARKRVDHVDGVAQYVEVGEDEDEADRFSRDMLIPPNAYEGFLSDGTFIGRLDQGVRQGAEHRARDRGRASAARRSRAAIAFQQPQEAGQHQRAELTRSSSLPGAAPR